MKLAIMQPYFFPYIGYWQLIHAVDTFVIYDDVTFIKGGWINRNRILVNNKPTYITIPLQSASSYKRICDISIHYSPVWKKKMIKTIDNSYRRSPFFEDFFPIVKELINYKSDNLSDFVANSIVVISKYLSLETEIIKSSRCYHNNNIVSVDRVIDICKREGTDTYINVSGGRSIYNQDLFERENITLQFLSTYFSPYKQQSHEFIPNLSIIDMLMNVDCNNIREHLKSFELISD